MISWRSKLPAKWCGIQIIPLKVAEVNSAVTSFEADGDHDVDFIDISPKGLQAGMVKYRGFYITPLKFLT